MNVRKFISFLFVITLLSVIACQPKSKKQSENTIADSLAGTFWDYTLPMEDRIDHLTSQLTLEEKCAQMMHEAPAIPRLGIPAYNWWSEALHGVARAGKATVFPQAIGLAATFDTTLIEHVFSAISDEARAQYNEATKRDNRVQYMGLTFWSPNVNIFRDPRWGRGQETYGEDPFLSGEIGAAAVRGLQGDDPKYLKTAAGAKHYVVHSGPELLRHEFNAQATPKDVRETYMPAFRRLVKQDVEAVMCAYNRTNGEACCGSEYLLKEVLRTEWGFDGHVVTDCGAIRNFYRHHGVSADEKEAAALAIKSGVNLNCGRTFEHLAAAVSEGYVTEKEVTENLKVLLRTRFKLGLFDPPEIVPFNQISTEVIHSSEHVELAHQAAAKSVVMLKNNGALPLKDTVNQIYINGPNAASVQALLGNYFGINGDLVTIMEGIANRVQHGVTIEYRQGSLLDRPKVNPVDWTTGEAAKVDATIAVFGITQLLEGEEGESIASTGRGDRVEPGLPANQVEYIKKLRTKREHDKPIILVVTGGSPIDLSEVEPYVDAILFAWYPGEQGGNAIADIIFGNVNPSGRLPITFTRGWDHLPDFEDYSMRGRTYRYMEEGILYPFGFGLSFSDFKYSDLKLSQNEIRDGESVTVSVTVLNTSDIPGGEVVQLYLSDLEASVYTPISSLKGFQRIELEGGASQDIRFEITSEMLDLINEAGESVLEPGVFKVHVGGCSPGSRGRELGAANLAEAKLTLL